MRCNPPISPWSEMFRKTSVFVCWGVSMASLYLTGCTPEPESKGLVTADNQATAENADQGEVRSEPAPPDRLLGPGSKAVAPPASQPTGEEAPLTGGSVDKQSSTDPVTQEPSNGTTTLLVKPAVPVDFSRPEEAWPLFRGDPLATGVARSSLPPPSELQVLWKHKINKAEFQSTACIVLIEGRPVVVVGDMDGLIVALDLMTGEVVWSHKIKFGFVCSVAFHENRFYVGNIDGRFLCLDTHGKLLWEFQAGMEIDGSATFYGEWVLFTSQDSKLYALNAVTGEKAWEIEAGDQLRCAPTVIDGLAFLAGCDAVLHTIKLSDQSEEAGVDINSPTGCTPAAVGDLIFFGTEQAGMLAVNWRKKEKIWDFTDDGNVVTVHGNAAVTDELVIFGDTTRQVHALDPRSGERKWATALRSGVESSPVIVGNLIYVAGMDGRLYALEMTTGEIVWQKEFQGKFKASPAVAFSRLVIASDDGVIYCLGSAATPN